MQSNLQTGDNRLELTLEVVFQVQQFALRDAGACGKGRGRCSGCTAQGGPIVAVISRCIMSVASEAVIGMPRH